MTHLIHRIAKIRQNMQKNRTLFWNYFDILRKVQYSYNRGGNMTSYRRNPNDFGHHYEFDADEERARRNYERARKKSTSGKPYRRKRNQIRMSKKDFLLRLKAIAGVTAVSTALLIGGGNIVISHIKDIIVRDEAKIEFYNDVIGPEKHRTDNGKYFFYDYQDIAEKLESAEDFDEAVYLLYSNIGEYQSSLVLEHTDFGSFQAYLESRGYENTDDFTKDMEQRLLINHEIDQKEEELRRMSEEHPETEIVGGKTL